MSSNSVRHLFPQLLRNGYIPIPNQDKVCKYPKWNTILVDEDQCQRWARQLKWPAIGLRVEPPLLVLDIDISDPDIAAAARGIMPRQVLEGALERHGSPPKTAFFLRLSDFDEPFHEAHTRRFHFEGAPKPAFAMQAFAGGGGAHQFGAFGPHSHDAHGAVLKTYSWVGGRSPANVHIDELDELKRAEVFAILDAVDALLAGWPGLVVDALTKRGSGQTDVYDLSTDQMFIDVEGVEYSWGELIEEAKARIELGQPPLRITGSFTGDTSSTGSPRCKVYWSENRGLTIVDFKTGITHRMVRDDVLFDPNVIDILDKIRRRKP